MDFIYTTLLGLGVGFVSSFFGVGGGSLIVPVLYMIFPQAIGPFVIANSLGVIVFSTSINLYNFNRKKMISRWSYLVYMALGAGIGGLTGSFLVHLFSTIVLKRIFAVLIMVSIMKILLGKSHKGNADGSFSDGKEIPLVLVGLAGGLVAALTGLGGGIILIPLLASVLRVPFTQITIFSNAGMLAGSIVGVAFHAFHFTPTLAPIVSGHFVPFQFGQLNFLLIGMISFGAIFSSRFGVWLSTRVGESVKKWSICFLLILVVIKMFFF